MVGYRKGTVVFLKTKTFIAYNSITYVCLDIQPFAEQQVDREQLSFPALQNA